MRKKMSNFFLTRDIDFTIPTPSYTIPTLHTKSECYIDFKAYDPVSSSLRRKKYMTPMKGKKNERKYLKGDEPVHEETKHFDGEL